MIVALLAASTTLAPEAAPAESYDLRREVTPSVMAVITADTDCNDASRGEIVVCGRRSKDYRLDPDVVAAINATEAPAQGSPVSTGANSPTCRSVGPNGCPGEGQIPVTAIAFAVAKAAVQAATGEDWKEGFRTRPEQYQAYLDSKARRKARARPKVELRLGR